MVRTATPKERESSEERENPRKKASGKKKNPATGVWPCKINGCNKQFAREADLKRHQRTTKQHSVPGFACPQCDAAFTRTDALRRHQKSRHNGVIVDPIEIDKPDISEDSMKQNSRDGTPKEKGKDGEGAEPSTSHYRQHTATTDGAPVNHPTSSTRNWPPPPPWATDAAPSAASMPNFPLGPPSVVPYFPQPFYRPSSNSATPVPAQPPSDPATTLRKVVDNAAAEAAAAQDGDGNSSGPVIDPSLGAAESSRETADLNNSDLTSSQENDAAMAAISFQLQQALAESAKHNAALIAAQNAAAAAPQRPVDTTTHVEDEGRSSQDQLPSGDGGDMANFDIAAHQAAIESLLAESGDNLLNSDLLARAFPSQ